jgi:hypothetical protein
MRGKTFLLVALLTVALGAGSASAASPPKLMAGQDNDLRTLFRIKPRSVLIQTWYCYFPNGYGGCTQEWGELMSLRWSSWTATRAVGTGTYVDGDGGHHRAFSVVASHPSKGRFRRLSFSYPPNRRFVLAVDDASQDLWRDLPGSYH